MDMVIWLFYSDLNPVQIKTTMWTSSLAPVAATHTFHTMVRANVKNMMIIMGSNVSILGFGRLEMGLGPGCLWQYVVVHEILHSLGFQHEQKRPDKDDYIQMRWDNIKVC